MASIGPKNPFKKPVDKRAQREAKIAALVRENHARTQRTQQQRVVAGAPNGARKEEETKHAEPLPAVRAAGQSAGAPGSPAAAAAGAGAGAGAAAPKSYAIEHSFPATIRRPASAGVKAAGDVPRDRVRTKGARHTIPPTVFPEPYPDGLCESLHRADFTGRRGAPAQATMSTSKLWKFVGPNSPPAALAASQALSSTTGSLSSTGSGSGSGAGQTAVNVRRGRRSVDDGSSGGNIFASRYENTQRPSTVEEVKRYSFAGQQTASQAAYVEWKGHRPSQRAVPATDRLVAAPLFANSTQRDEFPRFADATAAKSRGAYDPQTVWRYPKQGLSTETRDFKTDKSAHFGPKPRSTRPSVRPPQALRVPPSQAPFLFGSSLREEFPSHTVTGPGRRPAKGPAHRWNPPAPHSDGRDFLTDVSAHYIHPQHMPDGAGLSKSIKF